MLQFSYWKIKMHISNFEIKSCNFFISHCRKRTNVVVSGMPLFSLCQLVTHSL